MTEIVIRYIHFLGLIFLSSAVVAQHLITSLEVTKEQFKKMLIIDLVYGICALMVLFSGLALWLFVGKDSSFYTANGIFHAKITVFILLGLLSIYPTRYFLKNRHSESETIKIPKTIIMIQRMELLLLVILPLLAALMAGGYGLK